MLPYSQIGSTFAALVTSAIGIVTATIGTLLAQAVSPDVAPWVSAGGATAAVGGLVYVAKKLASGELVAAPIDELLDRADERERKLYDLIEDSRNRESALRDLIFAERRRT